MIYFVLLTTYLVSGIICVKTFKSSNIRSLYGNYIYVLTFFFLFRITVLVFDFDFIFPSYIVVWNLTQLNYIYAFFGFLIWILSFYIFMIINNNGNVIINNQKENYFINCIIFVSILAYIYFILALLGAGSIQGLIYYVRINSQFEFGFMSSFPSIALMFSTIYFSCYKNSLFMNLNIFLLVIIHMLTGDRSGIIFSFFIYFVSLYSYNKISFKYFLTILPLGMVIATLLKSFRSSVQLGMYVQEETIIHSISSGLNLNVYDAYVTIINYVNNGVPLRYGYDFLLGFIGLIPRAFWNDKPDVINTGVSFIQLFSQRQMGAPISAMGEWYWNFGFLGFIIGGFITYIFIKICSNLIKSYGKYYYGLSLYMIFHVVQTGFTNLSIRELFLTLIILYIPSKIMEIRFKNENTASK